MTKLYEIGGGEIHPVFLTEEEVVHTCRVRMMGILCRDYQLEDKGQCTQMGNPNSQCSYTFQTDSGRREIHICLVQTEEQRNAQEQIDNEINFI